MYTLTTLYVTTLHVTTKERPKVEVGKVNYVPFIYILFNDQLEVGTKGMLVNNKLTKN
jgi:hypothetical protein